jgi:alpha-N-arabinofuranosidase
VKKARIKVDPDFLIGEVDPRLYGSFIEHLGRAVYGGIYEPEHPTADDMGFRGDVLELVKELGVPSCATRAATLSPATTGRMAWVRRRRARGAWTSRGGPWRPTRSVRTSSRAWAERAGAEVMMAVNLGTRGVDAARNLVEYCNHPLGSRYSDLRRAHGVERPHGFKVWCLGNEMDGPWQIGQKTGSRVRPPGLRGGEGDEVGRPLHRARRLRQLLLLDADLRRVGEDGLRHTYDHVEYVSLHTYYRNLGGRPRYLLARSLDMDAFIGSVISTCDFVKGEKA